MSFNEIPYSDKASVDLKIRETTYPLFIQSRAGWIRKGDELGYCPGCNSLECVGATLGMTRHV